MEKMLGVMLDCSRNAVMKPESVKKYADIIKKMGYNTMMLYMEDTYEIDTQPYFGHLRGRYSKEELKDIDSYCSKIGIELVACIQTLAHLQSMFKWNTVYDSVNDCDDILLIGDEKTYELIDDMLKTISQCFSSKKIHIGMDEAYKVGSGNYLKTNGHRDRFDVINEHLHKVCEIAEKYDLKPMIWSDMFCKLAEGLTGTDTQYGNENASKILEKTAMPNNVSLVYWDYYSTDAEHYKAMIRKNKLFGRSVYFAGGAWTWKGFAPDNTFSIKATDAAVCACQCEGVDGVFFTIWGDDGAECSHFSVLPTLMYAAEKLNGNNDIDSIKEKFKTIVGVDFDSFLLFDKLDTPGGIHNKSASKYLLYNDPFMGMRDFMCTDKDNDYYNDLADKIHSVSQKGEFELLFESYELLCRALSVKSALGIKTREAYLNKDIKAINGIIDQYDLAIDMVKDFHGAHQKRWFKDYKPHGFDVQDMRLGGVVMRLTSCKNRLCDYVSGKIDEIPELSEPVLDKANNNNPHWWRCITPNVITMNI